MTNKEKMAEKLRDIIDILNDEINNEYNEEEQEEKALQGYFTLDTLAEHIKEGSLDLIELLGVEGCYTLLNNLFIDLQEINQTDFDDFIYKHNLIFNDDLVNNNLLDDLNDEMKEKWFNNLFCSATLQQQEKVFKEYKRQNGLYELLSSTDCEQIARDYIDDNGIFGFIDKDTVIDYLQINL